MTLSLYAMFISCRPGQDTSGFGLCPVPASVGGPLDGIEVDSFFVHLPQRAHLAQLADALLDELHREVDVLLGREAAEGEADRAVGELVVAAQGAQHVRGLERSRGARR